MSMGNEKQFQSIQECITPTFNN